MGGQVESEARTANRALYAYRGFDRALQRIRDSTPEDDPWFVWLGDRIAELEGPIVLLRQFTE